MTAAEDPSKDVKIQSIVPAGLRDKVQAYGQKHDGMSVSKATAELIARGLMEYEAPAHVAAPGPNLDDLHAHAMRELGTAHTILGLVLRLMSDHNATKEDKGAALDQLRSACAALEDTL